MCLLIAYSRIVEDAPLIIGANRDERYNRPAEVLVALRAKDPRILGGRDGLALGSWLCVNEQGVVAGVTNRPTPLGRDPSMRSRGELPIALAAHKSARLAVEALVAERSPRDYNPFWLLAGDRDALFYLATTSHGEFVVEELGPGIHVLENNPLTAQTAKSSYVRSRLAGSEKLDYRVVRSNLTGLLGDHTMPGSATTDPSPLRRPEMSACCVHTDGYGTRSSAIITVPSQATSPIELHIADGPPCITPFEDRSNAWLSDNFSSTSPF